MEALLDATAHSLSHALPARRKELIVRAQDGGRYVVKDPRNGDYFDLGEQEHFLLSRLDGQSTAQHICKAFEDQFGEALPEEDLHGFLDLAQAQNFLIPAKHTPSRVDETTPALDKQVVRAEPLEPVERKPRSWPNLLYWRVSLFDPDRLFNWLAPRIGFIWTRGFVVVSLLFILLAAGVVWSNWGEIISCFAGALRWQTVIVVWLTLLIATTLHEFAHGLTCKRFGGEVHEVGFLSMFFMPCLYCNVSDAWLFREKSKRLLVTLAGGYCDLCFWALAVLMWRITLPDSLLNYVALVVMSVLGARVLFNFNPLMKLDGYYLLSDWKGIPNLQQRGADRAKAHIRRVFWGGPRPAPDAHGKFLTAYGLSAWTFSVIFIGFMLVALFQFLYAGWGLLAFAIVGPLGWLIGRGLIYGLGGGEIQQMIRKRRKRTLILGLILAGLPTALTLIPMEDRVSGTFQVRPLIRAEVRAPATAFIREVHVDEGDRVSPGAIIVRLEIPDLVSRIAQKRAEVGEAEAKLRLLEAGSRPEEVLEQRRRVERGRQWRDLAQQDLERARKSLQEDLSRAEKLISQYEAEQQFAQKSYDRVRQLRDRGNASEAELQETGKELEVCKAKVEQTRAQKRSLQVVNTRDAETELAKRVKELADAEGTLAVLEAGARPEEIDAARAYLTRAREEARYLESQQEKLVVCSPIGGLIATARLREKIGQYVREGELICQVEEPQALEVEIMVNEQDVSRVQPELLVELKARALPFETFQTRVGRIAPNTARLEPSQPQNGVSAAPAASRPDLPGNVIVYCRLDGASPHLKPGMTGFARVSCGQRPIGEIMLNRTMRYVRTEFW